LLSWAGLAVSRSGVAYANDPGQWPAVAYMLDAVGDDSHELHWIAFREAAGDLAPRWATEITQKADRTYRSAP
jgi:hypothetical protein